MVRIRWTWLECPCCLLFGRLNFEIGPFEITSATWCPLHPLTKRVESIQFKVKCSILKSSSVVYCNISFVVTTVYVHTPKPSCERGIWFSLNSQSAGTKAKEMCVRETLRANKQWIEHGGVRVKQSWVPCKIYWHPWDACLWHCATIDKHNNVSLMSWHSYKKHIRPWPERTRNKEGQSAFFGKQNVSRR